MIYIAENKILEILEKPQLTKGIEKYTFLQNNLYCVDVANNEEYKNNYKNFYRMARRGKTFCNQYFSIMENLKNVKNIDFETIFEQVYTIKNTNEISFSSKMLHSLNPKFPIWDSIVTKGHFKINVPYYKANKNLLCEKYLEYTSQFEEYKLSNNGKMLIDLFNKRYPNINISDTKKIDFILWQARD